MDRGWGILVVADHRQSMRRASLPFDVVVKGSAKSEMASEGRCSLGLSAPNWVGDVGDGTSHLRL